MKDKDNDYKHKIIKIIDKLSHFNKKKRSITSFFYLYYEVFYKLISLPNHLRYPLTSH
jgi:hypothetical protein